MFYRLAADIVVVLHFSFIVFVIVGGFLAIRWPRIAWLHLPIAAYGALIEFFSFVCILTPLEQWLRIRSGAEGYDTSFTEHYILPLIYPSVLTYRLQLFLGISVVVINVIAYSLVLRKRKIRSRRSEVPS